MYETLCTCLLIGKEHKTVKPINFPNNSEFKIEISHTIYTYNM